MGEAMLIAILSIAAFGATIEAFIWGYQKLAIHFCTHLWMSTGKCARCGHAGIATKL